MLIQGGRQLLYKLTFVVFRSVDHAAEMELKEKLSQQPVEITTKDNKDIDIHQKTETITWIDLQIPMY